MVFKPVLCFSSMKKPKQLSFFETPRLESGGTVFLGKRKSRRILSTKLPIHLVLKSEKAVGALSFVNHQKMLRNLISRTSIEKDIRLYKFAINFNHIHLVIRIKHPDDYNAWIRELTGEIVTEMSKETSTPLSRFFTARPYTRCGSWGREFENLISYQELNEMEIVGIRPSTGRPAQN